MIAGVWSPSGPGKAEDCLARMSGIVGAPPAATWRGENGALAVWGMAARSHLDADRKLAIVGIPRSLPDRVGLDNAGRLGGDYAVVAKVPDGLLLGGGSAAGRCMHWARLSDGGVVACSRLEPLLACVEDTTPDSSTLGALVLVQAWADAAATVVREVRRVRACGAMTIGASGKFESAPADIDLRPRTGSPDELAEELRAVIERVVRRSIEGSRRVAVLVSGGLDSSAVLALAVAAARGAGRTELDAVTWSFAGPGDDRPYLRELCDSLGIVPIRLSSIECGGNVIRSLVADGAPYIWPTAAALVTARERARDRGADLVLSGMGGDQVFNGDPRIFASRAWSGHFCEGIVRAARFGRFGRSRALRTAKLLVAPPVLFALPSVERMRRRRYAASRWPWAGPKLRQIVRDDYLFHAPNREWMRTLGDLKLKRLEAGQFVLLAANRRQMEAATGLAQVDPFLDDEVVHLVSSFPQDALLHDERQRGLFRHAMRPLLPDRVRLRRDKAQFEAAIAEMVQNADLDSLRSLADMRLSADLGLVEPASYRRHFEAVLAAGERSPDWLAIWPALAVEAFARARWGEGRMKEGTWRASA